MAKIIGYLHVPGLQQLCGYVNPLFGFAPHEDWDYCEFRLNGEVFFILFIFSLPFPSFPWSNFHLPEQLQAGEGAGGGRSQAVSRPFSNPGSGHGVPWGTLTIFLFFLLFPVLSLPLPPFLLFPLSHSVYTLNSQSLATGSSGVRGQGSGSLGG